MSMHQWPVLAATLLLGGVACSSPAGSVEANPSPPATATPLPWIGVKEESPDVKPAAPGARAQTGCYSNSDCSAGEQCVGCGSPPGCKQDQPCPAVCYGSCVPGTPAPVATRAVLNGSITVNSRPWSAVWIDGKLVKQETPLIHHRISAGRHALRLVNEKLGFDETRPIEVPADGTVKVDVDLAKKTFTVR